MAALLSAIRTAWLEDARRHPPMPDADLCCAVALALLALTGFTLQMVGGYHAGFEELNGLAPWLPRWLWQGLTTLGDERAAIALSLLLARRHPHVLYTILVAALLATLANRGIKLGADQLRPPAVLAPDSFHLLGPANRRLSFPSGHTVTAFVFFGVLAYRFRRWRPALLAIASVAGLSRVAIGVHWPIDVVAGAFIGLASAWAAVHIAHRVRFGASPYAHLGIVALAAAGAVLLVVDDGGYESTLWLRLPIAVATIGLAVWDYLMVPWRAKSVGRIEPQAKPVDANITRS